MTIQSLRFNKLPRIHLMSVLNFLKFCSYYFGYGSGIGLLKELKPLENKTSTKNVTASKRVWFQLAVVWAAVFTAGDVQQHHLVVLVMVIFSGQLCLYAQLLVGDGRQYAWSVWVVLLSGLTCLGCLELPSGGLRQPVQSPVSVVAER